MDVVVDEKQAARGRNGGAGIEGADCTTTESAAGLRLPARRLTPERRWFQISVWLKIQKHNAQLHCGPVCMVTYTVC